MAAPTEPRRPRKITLARRDVLILFMRAGFGKEGRATNQQLIANLPNLVVALDDVLLGDRTEADLIAKIAAGVELDATFEMKR